MDISTDIEAYVRGYKGASRDPSDHPLEASTWVMNMVDVVHAQYPCLAKERATVFAKWGKSNYRPEGYSFYFSGNEDKILERINLYFINIGGKPLRETTAPKIQDLDF